MYTKNFIINRVQIFVRFFKIFVNVIEEMKPK